MTQRPAPILRRKLTRVLEAANGPESAYPENVTPAPKRSVAAVDSQVRERPA